MVTLIQSFYNQDLLRVFNPPQWYTISGGSYVPDKSKPQNDDVDVPQA
jgi:hypothetical protein